MPARNPNHSGYAPSLEVDIPVVNIGERNTQGLRDAFRDSRGIPAASSKIIDRVLMPVERGARSVLLSHLEVLNIHKFLGIDADEDYVDEVVGFMDKEVIPKIPEGINIATFPMYEHQAGGNRVLSVAGGRETLQARTLVVAAMAKFHKLQSIPEHLLLPDEEVTRVWIARSHSMASKTLIDKLASEINEDYDHRLLDERTLFGKAQALPNPPRTS